MYRNSVKLSLLTTAGLMLAACGSDSNSSGNQPTVSLNLASHAAGAAATRMASVAAPYTVTDGSGNTLVFESVQLVMREIELKRADADVACGADDSNSDLNDSSDCEEIEFGPTIFDVPLGAGAARAMNVTVAAGSYDKLEFEIHKPSSSDDAAFVAANPDFNGVSVRVTGTYNGVAFTYTSDLDVEQEQEFVPPLAVVDGQSTELTLFVDIDNWFRTETGVLLNPTTANDGQPNEGQVKSNIETSLNAFDDDDRDGIDD